MQPLSNCLTDRVKNSEPGFCVPLTEFQDAPFAVFFYRWLLPPTHRESSKTPDVGGVKVGEAWIRLQLNVRQRVSSGARGRHT